MGSETAPHRDFELVIDAWELECCGPALEPGTLLELTLTRKRWPQIARVLDWPEVVLYGSLHGPDQEPRVTLRVGEIREILGELEPDPAGPSGAVRLRADSLQVVRQVSLPARLGLTALDEEPPRSGPPTVAVALRGRQTNRDRGRHGHGGRGGPGTRPDDGPG